MIAFLIGAGVGLLVALLWEPRQADPGPPRILFLPYYAGGVWWVPVPEGWRTR